MTICDRIAARSMALAALPEADAERAAAENHAASCAGCTSALNEGARLLEIVAAELRPERASQVLARAERAVLDEWDREPASSSRRSDLHAVALAGVIFVALLVTARHLVTDLASWAVAGAAASLAALLAAGAPAGRRPMLIAFAASLGFALTAASGAAVAADASGLSCLGLEVLCGLAPFVLDALGRGGATRSVEATAALAGAAALSAQAALHLSCPVRGALLHLIGFHVAGVVAAAAVAARLQMRYAVRR